MTGIAWLADPTPADRAHGVDTQRHSARPGRRLVATIPDLTHHSYPSAP